VGGCVDWIDVAAGCCERGNELADSLNCGELYSYTTVISVTDIGL
jgi:hypothetical protein